MTTMRNKRFFAVGVACNVFENSDEENVEIAKALDLSGYADKLWKMESIQRAKHGRRATASTSVTAIPYAGRCSSR